jgi:hypothetical protein
MNKFMKDHGRHLLMFPIVLLLLPLLVNFQLLDLHNVGVFFRLFLALFGSTVVGFCIEWYQAVVYGANKGEPGKRFWQQHWFKDMVVTGVSGFLGGIVAELLFI